MKPRRTLPTRGAPAFAPPPNALRPPPPPEWADGAPEEDNILVKALLIFAGATCFLEVKVFGHMSIAEIIFLLGGVYLLKDVRTLISGQISRRILLLGSLWLFSQILTDLVRSTAFEDWVRGWTKIVLILSQFGVMYLLIRNHPARVWCIAFGLALGLTASGLLKYSSFGAVVLWKFGLALPALFFVCLAFFRWPNSVGYLFGLLGLVAVSVLLTYRSFAGVCLSGFALSLLATVLHRRAQAVNLRPLAQLLAVGSALGLLFGVFVFSLLALNGVLGDEERFRTEIQVRRGLGLVGDARVGEYVGLLAGGRSEFVIALRAIADSPIIGHGSWAKNYYYSDMWLAMSGEGNMSEIRPEAVEETEPGLIPSHSHILSAWLEGGLGGLAFWSYALVLVYASLALALARPHPFNPFLIPVFTLFIWDIFFSPLSSQNRLFIAFYLAIAASLIERHRWIISQLCAHPRP